ncbi:hypothetical protein A7P54_03870 [Acinetobacter sp. Ac_3412]|uniref:hypothetical protein n=1 Tax=Acinetobacter sp. Ac_3412 TaxID=1848935 RepID=UPI00148F8D29|nr:hypothetical protein [Acinetobacter sp. Ac_3412]NNP75557.1 hypothetical protein [Acinetobacter sp. Ac_3412]
MLEKILIAVLAATLTFLTSIYMEWFKSKIGHKKNVIDQWKTDFEVAEKLSGIFLLPNNKMTRPQKDRFSKLFFKNDNANFSDLKLLIDLKDLDNLAENYFRAKEYFYFIKDSENEDYKLITFEYPKFKMLLFLAGYLIFLILGALPYLSNTFGLYLKSLVDSGAYVWFSILTSTILICFYISYVCVRKLSDIVKAKIFLVKLNEHLI